MPEFFSASRICAQGGPAEPYGTSDSYCFYKGSQLTVRFCSRRQGPNRLHSGVAEAAFQKPKENQRFPILCHGCPPWCTRGHQLPSLVPVAGNYCFPKVLEGFTANHKILPLPPKSQRVPQWVGRGDLHENQGIPTFPHWTRWDIPGSP